MIALVRDCKTCPHPRNTLSTLFTFSNLKAYGGADLQEIFNRLTNAKRHIEKYGISAVEFYPPILTRGGHLRCLHACSVK
jgi:uncharacterized protein with GYD domain